MSLRGCRNASMENRFGKTSPYTIGVVEEFQLVNPSTRELAPAIATVLETAPSGFQRLAPELFQDCVKMRTPVFPNVAELVRHLPPVRGEVGQAAERAGVGIAASGLHPISDPFVQKITLGERYERMEEELGTFARLQIIYALHIHVW